jgi:hypothetical protein
MREIVKPYRVFDAGSRTATIFVERNMTKGECSKLNAWNSWHHPEPRIFREALNLAFKAFRALKEPRQFLSKRTRLFSLSSISKISGRLICAGANKKDCYFRFMVLLKITLVLIFASANKDLRLWPRRNRPEGISP